jgi:general secretion pathway protein J
MLLSARRTRINGFTLLEILIALFVFTLLSLILTQVLHNVITVQSVTERNAERLHALQIALLMISQDIEQSVNRAVLDVSGKEQAAFIGMPAKLTLTRVGFANPGGMLTRSNMQRVRYVWHDTALWRETWQALDQAPDALPQSRCLLTDLTQARFQYLDKRNTFHDDWPDVSDLNQPLPRAVRVKLTFSDGGEVSQLYVMPVQSNQMLS